MNCSKPAVTALAFLCLNISFFFGQSLSLPNTVEPQFTVHPDNPDHVVLVCKRLGEPATFEVYVSQDGGGSFSLSSWDPLVQLTFYTGSDWSVPGTADLAIDALGRVHLVYSFFNPDNDAWPHVAAHVVSYDGGETFDYPAPEDFFIEDNLPAPGALKHLQLNACNIPGSAYGCVYLTASPSSTVASGTVWGMLSDVDPDWDISFLGSSANGPTHSCLDSNGDLHIALTSQEEAGLYALEYWKVIGNGNEITSAFFPGFPFEAALHPDENPNPQITAFEEQVWLTVSETEASFSSTQVWRSIDGGGDWEAQVVPEQEMSHITPRGQGNHIALFGNWIWGNDCSTQVEIGNTSDLTSIEETYSSEWQNRPTTPTGLGRFTDGAWISPDHFVLGEVNWDNNAPQLHIRNLDIAPASLPTELKTTVRTYPNPAADQLRVHLPPDTHQARIYSLTSQLMYTSEAQTFDINTSTWPRGAYQLISHSASGSSMQTVLLQ